MARVIVDLGCSTKDSGASLPKHSRPQLLLRSSVPCISIVTMFVVHTKVSFTTLVATVSIAILNIVVF